MSLKNIGLLIKAGEYDKAESEIMAIEKAGNSNATIYLCGLRCATETGKLNSALLYLQKVKELDPNNPEINKAECSVYEKFPEQITKEHITIIDKVIADEKVSDTRRVNLKKLKWSAMIRLGLINEFRQLDNFSEAMKNVEICGQILIASNLDKKISPEMARTAFLNAKDELSQKQHLYGTLLFLNEPEFDQLAFEHANRFGCADQNIMKNVYGRIVHELIKEGQLSSLFENAAKVENFVLQKKPTTEWLTHLFANEIGQAYDCLSKLLPDEYRIWPLCGLAFYTFFATRQFTKLIKLYRSTVFPDEDIFKIIELEAVFENHADEAELKQILRLIENSNVKDEKKIIEIKLRAKILLGVCDENEIRNSELSSATKYGLLAELNFACKNYSNAKKAAEECLNSASNENQWRSELTLAKLKWIVDEDFDQAELDLRDLYSKNPFVADILAAMAEFYVALDEFDSAKQLIDHAVLVNPSSRAFRELQDNVCAALKTSVEERIQNLNNYIALKPYSMWAVKHVTVLEVQSGRFEEAINKLRRVIHALPEDVDVDGEVSKAAASIWAYVGLVNCHRGQARSTMYAFESAVTLEPDNPSFLLQLALAQKNLYKFEEVFATIQKLRSIESLSPEIREHAHFLFLESLSSYAEQLIPGEKQLRQLYIFFTAVGAMSLTEWYPSRALSFSVAGALTLLRKYNNDIVNAFILEIPHFAQKFGINKNDDILDAEVAIMLNLLSVEQNVGAINEAGVRILSYATNNGSQKLAVTARRFFRKALLFPGTKSDIRSLLYLNLGLTFCVGRINLENALHCFLRSLQLNKHNPSALSIIGLLCLKMNNNENASQAFNTAHILEPLQAEHWYGRALLAQQQNDLNVTEVMKKYQHSLTIKPCTQAIEAFAYYLIQEKAAGHPFEKFEFDFVTVRHLLYVNEHTDRILYSLATFAEHFHHLNEAALLINKVSPNLNVLDATKIRMNIAAETASSCSDDGLKRLYSIYHGSLSEAVAASGFKPVVLINFLLGSLANDAWEIFWKFYRAKLYPILVGFVNALEMDLHLSRGIIATLRTNRPPHKLLEVFPVQIPKHDLDPVSRRKEEDSFVLYDPSVQPLYELFSFIQAKYESEQAAVIREEDFLHLPPYQPQPSEQSEFESIDDSETQSEH